MKPDYMTIYQNLNQYGRETQALLQVLKPKDYALFDVTKVNRGNLVYEEYAPKHWKIYPNPDQDATGVAALVVPANGILQQQFDFDRPIALQKLELIHTDAARAPTTATEKTILFNLQRETVFGGVGFGLQQVLYRKDYCLDDYLTIKFDPETDVFEPCLMLLYIATTAATYIYPKLYVRELT